MTSVVDTDTHRLGGAWHIPRSRGAVTGLLLMLLGIWGALIPFVGPYFHFAFTQDHAWTWSSARFWLQVLPGVATFVGGFLLAASANRGTAVLGAWLAIAAGAWFVLGPTLTGPWHLGLLGAPQGGSSRAALTWISLFYGLGATVIFLGSTAWGRLSVRGVRDVAAAQRRRAQRAARDAAPAALDEQQVYPGDRPMAPTERPAGYPPADYPPADYRPGGTTSPGEGAPGERAGTFGRHRRHSTR